MLLLDLVLRQICLFLMNMYLKLISIIICGICVFQTEATHLECDPDQASCSFTDVGSLEKNRTKEIECCNQTVENYYRNWGRGSHYLSTYLQTLKTWQCPQFEDECAKETFAYTDFTQLIYMTFCNQTEVEGRCYSAVADVIRRQNPDSSFQLNSWRDLTERLDVTRISDEDLQNLCIQIAMLNTDPKRPGRFHEIINPLAPLCDIIWCGFDEKILTTREISMWTCLPSCHANIIVTGVVCGLLAVATTICNAIVLIVFGTMKNQMNGTTVYKMSIAVADMLVGIFVFPTFINTMLTTLMARRTLGEITNGTTLLPANNSDALDIVSLGGIHEPTGGLFCDRVSQSYLDAVGFFTTLSLSVSLYSLAAACIDRFIAVYRPMKYQHYAPVSMARKIVIGTWILGILFSTLPYYVESLRYRVISSVFVTSGNVVALILYLFAFALPFLVMWIFSMATFCAFRIHNQNTRVLKSSVHHNHKTNVLENRLARTLGIMVGVFTICLLPVVIMLIVPHFIRGISVFDPENLDPQKSFSFHAGEVIVIIILSTNSLWNFFIYNARDKRFREAMKDLVTRVRKPKTKRPTPTISTNVKYTGTNQKSSSQLTTGIHSSSGANANHSSSMEQRRPSFQP